MRTLQENYITKLIKALNSAAMDHVQVMAECLMTAWNSERSVFICGNGGSGANAIHLANDFIFGAGRRRGKGLRVEALTANSAIITCLANDTGYENIFAEQLRVKASPNDVLIALSGSGNSENIVRAIEIGNELRMETFAILGFTGGRCKAIAKHPIHFEIDDMQVAEDLQMIAGHMCMQWLHAAGAP